MQEPVPGSIEERGRLVRRSAAVLVTGRILSAFLSMASLSILGRHLTLEEFGVQSYLVTLLGLLHVLTGFGGNAVATAEIARREEDAPGVLAALLGLRSGLALAGAAGILVLFVTTETGESRAALLITVPFFLFFACSFVEPWFQVRQRMEATVLARLLGQVVFVVALVFLARGERLSLGMAAFLTAASLALAHTSMLLAFRGLGGPRGLRPRLGPSLALLRRAFPQGMATVFGLLYFHLDTVMLRFMAGAEETGIYGGGYRLFAASVMVPTLLAAPLLPELARGEEARRAFLPRALRLHLVLGGIVIVASYLCADLAVAILYPEGGLERSAEVIRILGLAFFGVCLGAPAGVLLVAKGAQSLWARITFIGLLVNIVGNVLLIPRMGAVGAALTTVVTELLVGGVALGVGLRVRARSDT
jgi:O-antigen/teichoic acid export membrane protein